MTIITFVNSIRYMTKKLKEHAVSAYAAQAGYFIIMSFLPFLMILMTMIQYLPITEEALTDLLRGFLPSTIDTYVLYLLNEIYSLPTIKIISIAAILTLWSAGKSFMSIINGFNFIHGIPETRNYISLRIYAAAYTLIFAVLILATLMLLVFGNTLFGYLIVYFPFIEDLALLIISIRYLAILLVLFLFFLIMYTFIPNQKTSLLTEMPGAAVASVSWVAFSSLYSIYIDHFANFNTYGSLTVLVFTMLWLYVQMYLIFIGCELNQTLKQTQLFKKLRLLRKMKKGRGH